MYCIILCIFLSATIYGQKDGAGQTEHNAGGVVNGETASIRLEYAEKALERERALGDSAKIGVCLSHLANAQLELSLIPEAQRSLTEAIPLLHQSKNYVTWGKCLNQLGDIFANKGRNDKAASYYYEAAMFFMKEGDMYNELHAREGLYRVTKASSPSEAMLHLERVRLLKDSIYERESTAAFAKYNALYNNDKLQAENERIEQRNRTFQAALVVSFALLLVVLALVALHTHRRHILKEEEYERNISLLEKKCTRLQTIMEEDAHLSDEDKEFLSQLSGVIYVVSEKGKSDTHTIAQQMGMNVSTLRQRLSETISVTPKNYIMRMRMQKAKYLLYYCPDLNIAEVAYKCGYSHVPSFTRAYTNFYGTTPTEEKNESLKELKEEREEAFPNGFSFLQTRETALQKEPEEKIRNVENKKIRNAENKKIRDVENRKIRNAGN